MTELARDYRESNSELALSFARCLQSWGLGESTQADYNSTIAEFIELFGSRTVVGASRVDIHIFLEKLMSRGLQPASVNRHAYALRAFFKFLRFTGLVTRDPSREVSGRKVPIRSPRVLTVEEVEKLIAAAKNPFERAVCEVLYGTAMRVSELCALRLVDVDFASNVVTILRGKGGKDRYSLFGSHASAAMREYIGWRKPKTFLFEAPSRHGSIRRTALGWTAFAYFDGVQRYVRIGKLRDLPTEEDAREAFEKIVAGIPGFHPSSECPYETRTIRTLIDRLACLIHEG